MMLLVHHACIPAMLLLGILQFPQQTRGTGESANTVETLQKLGLILCCLGQLKWQGQARLLRKMKAGVALGTGIQITPWPKMNWAQCFYHTSSLITTAISQAWCREPGSAQFSQLHTALVCRLWRVSPLERENVGLSVGVVWNMSHVSQLSPWPLASASLRFLDWKQQGFILF